MKFYVLTIFILGAMSAAYSDPALSVSGGINVSTITGKDSLVTSSSLRSGITLNFGLEQNFSKHFTLRTGVSLESRGEKNKSLKVHDSIFSEEPMENLKLLYLQIPIIAQVNFPIDIISINAFGGPELSIFLNGKRVSETTSRFAADGTTPARSAIAYDTLDFSRDMKMLDAGLRIGLGFEVNTGSFGAAFIRPSAYIGLIDLLQTNTDKAENANLKGKHQAFSIVVGYKFNIQPPKQQSSSSTTIINNETSSAPAGKKDGEFNLDGYNSSATE